MSPEDDDLEARRRRAAEWAMERARSVGFEAGQDLRANLEAARVQAEMAATVAQLRDKLENERTQRAVTELHVEDLMRQLDYERQLRKLEQESRAQQGDRVVAEPVEVQPEDVKNETPAAIDVRPDRPEHPSGSLGGAELTKAEANRTMLGLAMMCLALVGLLCMAWFAWNGMLGEHGRIAGMLATIDEPAKVQAVLQWELALFGVRALLGAAIAYLFYSILRTGERLALPVWRFPTDVRPGELTGAKRGLVDEFVLRRSFAKLLEKQTGVDLNNDL